MSFPAKQSPWWQWVGPNFSLVLHFATLGLVLSLWLSVNTGCPLRDADAPGYRILPAAGATAGSPAAATWTPFSLSKREQDWALAAARQKVPSLCSPIRRLLTAQMALGPLVQGIPGDFVETGVYAGGTSIILLQALDAYDKQGTRKFWAADSFQGLPDPVEQDGSGTLNKGAAGQMASGRDVFETNVRAWKIASLSKRLRVLEGFFNETLPGAPIKTISYLRLDGDLYASTMDTLEALYDKVSLGGLIYVDDYGSFNGCRRAIDEFRGRRGITSPLRLQAMPEQLLDIDPHDPKAAWHAAWWVKTA